MKLFRTVQKLYQMMDIWPSQPNQQRSRFTTKNVLFFLFRLPILLSTLGYILFEKVTIIQRTHSFLVWITQSVCTINFVISFYKMPNIVEYIGETEQLIQKSKFEWTIWTSLASKFSIWSTKILSVSIHRIGENGIRNSSCVQRVEWKNRENVQKATATCMWNT